MDMQALIEEMGALIAKIKSGEATLGEIEAFTAAAAQLHERAVVLRYKSYEAKVYRMPVEPVQEIATAVVEKTDATLLEPPSREEEDVPVEQETPKVIYSEPDAVSNPVDPIPAEEPSFDLFADEPEEETFDLFSLEQDSEEEAIPFDPSAPGGVEASAAAEEVAMAAEIVEETELAEEATLLIPPSREEEGAPVAEAAVPETPLAEEAVTTPQSTWVEPVLTEESVTTIDELAAEEEPVDATPLIPPSKGEADSVPLDLASKGEVGSAMEHPVYKRLVADDNSLAARLMAIRLETLKGAFGFNERLQIIRELFDGSNEAFNQAIDTLDELDSKNEARKVVSGYANKFAWDKDSDLALEFVQKVERRYA